MLNDIVTRSSYLKEEFHSLFAYTEQIEQIKQICQLIDGLLLTGGVEDVDPSLYGEEPLFELGEIFPERDRMELLLTSEMLRLNKPIFAICRGCQVLNVTVGGSLYQDINTQCQTIQHRQKAQRSHLSHTIQIDEGTLLYKIMDTNKLKVNSFHLLAFRNRHLHIHWLVCFLTICKWIKYQPSSSSSSSNHSSFAVFSLYARST
jgi:gamma-glutamyl-gamma-aminobutyrate hydrolase PuuD